VNRRRFLYCLSSLAAVDSRAPGVFSLRPNPESGAECSEQNEQARSDGQLRVGFLGIAGVGVYFLDKVAQQLGYPGKTLAIENQADRVRWRHAHESILIDDDGSVPETTSDCNKWGATENRR
jgi:hypothetical protein